MQANLSVLYLTKILRRKAGKNVDPVALLVTDITAKGVITDLSKAFRDLRRFGIR